MLLVSNATKPSSPKLAQLMFRYKDLRSVVGPIQTMLLDSLSSFGICLDKLFQVKAGFMEKFQPLAEQASAKQQWDLLALMNQTLIGAKIHQQVFEMEATKGEEVSNEANQMIVAAIEEAEHIYDQLIDFLPK